MSYRVIPLNRSGLPNFPSTPEAYAKELAKELNNQGKLGYKFVGSVEKAIGREDHQFLVFLKGDE